jgi:hypothetical protein
MEQEREREREREEWLKMKNGSDEVEDLQKVESCG